MTQTGPPSEAPRRSIRSLGALMITLSALSPTIGVFVVGSDLLAQGGTGVFWAFVGAALLGLAMACVYAELVSAFPEMGGEYTIFGRVLGPPAGFAVLGLSLVGFGIALALTGLGAADYLRVIWPGAEPVPTALITVAAVTLIAALDIRTNALVTGTFLVIEMVSLAVLAGVGFAHPHRGAAVALHPVMTGAGGALMPATLAAMGGLGAGAVYAFNGYGSVVFVGEEMEDPRRSTARVIFWALGIGALFELVPLLGVIVGAPDLRALITSPAPFAAFLKTAAGPAVANLVSLSVALAIINTMIVNALMAGRLLFSTGRDRVWPDAVSRPLARLHPRLGSPVLATLVMGAAGLLWCLVPLKVLITIIASGTVVSYGGLCLAVMVGRRNGTTVHARFRMPLFPLAPIVGLVVLAGMAWSSLSDARVGRPGFAVMALIVACSVAYWRFVLRDGGRWRMRGPTTAEDRIG